MAQLPILEFPDPRLRTRAAPVDPAWLADAATQQLIDDMFETMYEAPGIGLAASQVDVHKRFMVIDVSEDRSAPRVFVNQPLPSANTLPVVAGTSIRSSSASGPISSAFDVIRSIGASERRASHQPAAAASTNATGSAISSSISTRCTERFTGSSDEAATTMRRWPPRVVTG